MGEGVSQWLTGVLGGGFTSDVWSDRKPWSNLCHYGVPWYKKVSDQLVKILILLVCFWVHRFVAGQQTRALRGHEASEIQFRTLEHFKVEFKALDAVWLFYLIAHCNLSFWCSKVSICGWEKNVLLVMKLEKTMNLSSHLSFHYHHNILTARIKSYLFWWLIHYSVLVYWSRI